MTKDGMEFARIRSRLAEFEGAILAVPGLDDALTDLIEWIAAHAPASPVQAGIDPLVANALDGRTLEAFLKELEDFADSHYWGGVICLDAIEIIRSQAERIAALERRNTELEPTVQKLVTAHIQLAEAREAMEKIKRRCTPTGLNDDITDLERDQRHVLAIADATLSRLKPGEKGGGNV